MVDLGGRRAEAAMLASDLDLALAPADMVLSAANAVQAGTVAAAVRAGAEELLAWPRGPLRLCGRLANRCGIGRWSAQVRWAARA